MVGDTIDKTGARKKTKKITQPKKKKLKRRLGKKKLSDLHTNKSCIFDAASKVLGTVFF